jgi:hypothetical protein
VVWARTRSARVSDGGLGGGLGPGRAGVGSAREIIFQYFQMISFPITNVALIWESTKSILLELHKLPNFAWW